MKVFLAYSAKDRELIDAVTTQLRSEEHEVIRHDELMAQTDVLSTISSELRSADVVIAVLAGPNANVYYELGLAAGAGVPALIVSSPGEVLPGDLTSVPYVQLTGDLLRDAKTIAWRVKEMQGLSAPKRERYVSAEAALTAAIRDPAVLEALPPREFERLLAEWFKDRGYEVSTTLQASDSGVDIIVRSPGDGQLMLIEAKKLSKQSRVSVESVRRLVDSVSAMSGALGVLVSTSGFTGAAMALGATAPIVLKTLEELLAAKSNEDLMESKKSAP